MVVPDFDGSGHGSDGLRGQGVEKFFNVEKGDGRERLAIEKPNWPIRTLARIDIIDGKVEIVE